MPVPDKTAISRPRAVDLIPGYRLDALVGKGGMGEVYRATQLSLERTVAVKLLSSELAKDPAFVARFDKEAAALAALSHPHIVSIVDKGRNHDTYYLVMEYVDGPSLREQMRSPLLDEQSSMRMTLEICRAIDYAHSRGVFHRDLKPENILFDEQAGGIPKVSDFGLAGFLKGAPESGPKFAVTETHMAMGTGAYMAPEQRIDASSADHRADIYSLGVIIYELLVGVVPVGNFDPPSQKKPGVDKRIDAIVARCLKPNPADRYQKVSELIADLEPLSPISTGLSVRKLSPFDRMRERLKRWAKAFMRTAALVTVAAAVIVLVVALVRSRSTPRMERRPGEVLASPLEEKGITAVAARRDEQPDRRVITLGEGPDRLSLLARGRAVTFEGTALSFPLSDTASPAGRVQPDLDEVDGFDLTYSGEVTTQVPTAGVWPELRRFLKGETSNPSTSLLLMGTTGRFAALTVFGDGREPRFEWELGDNKRGVMLGNRTEGSTRLELLVDRFGNLRAAVGTGKDRRPVGEPVPLGASWKHFFGGMPRPAMGCIEGTCAFRSFRFEVEHERPPEPVPPPSPSPQAPLPKAAAVHPPAPMKKSASPAKSPPLKRTGH